ncbi:hypothetical protein LGFR6_14690 [Lactococcus garvieae]
MQKHKKEQRSSKWAFLLYKESAPKDYLEVLKEFHIPFILSPWHDKDVNRETGEFKKAHKHGALFFDSLKSYSQVSELLTEHLTLPHTLKLSAPLKACMTTLFMRKILIKHPMTLII